MRLTRTAALLAALLPVSACGLSSSGGTATRATLSATSLAPIPPGAADVSLGDDDNGRTITLPAGQRLAVRLTADSYLPPTAAPSDVLTRTSTSGGYPTGKPVSALFTARSAGTTTITAVTDRACAHSQPRCLVATRQWRVTVTVH